MSADKPSRTTLIRRHRHVTVATAFLGVALLHASPAISEPADQLEQAIVSLRATGSCGPLRNDPVVQRAAEISNRSTQDYLNHAARFVPVSDPLVVLEELGSGAGQAIQIRGHGASDAEAIHGALLQGRAVIPDCSYDTFGTDVIRDPDNGLALVVAILSGP